MLLLRRILARLLYLLPVLWLVVSVVFLLIHIVPGDPIAQMLGESAAAADIAKARHDYRLDVPVARSPPSSPAWCGPPCWKNSARTTFAPRAPRAYPSA